MEPATAEPVGQSKSTPEPKKQKTKKKGLRSQDTIHRTVLPQRARWQLSITRVITEHLVLEFRKMDGSQMEDYFDCLLLLDAQGRRRMVRTIFWTGKHPDDQLYAVPLTHYH